MRKPHHVMEISMYVNGRACAVDRWTSHLQCGHQGGLARGADGRVLVVDVQIGEGGVHLHADPNQNALSSSDE